MDEVKIVTDRFEVHDLRPAARAHTRETLGDRLRDVAYLQRAEQAYEDRHRVASLAAQLFAASIDHAPHAHAFEYSEDAVLQATASARKYAVAQARALLQEVDAQLCGHTWEADRAVVPPGEWFMRCSKCGATKKIDTQLTEDAQR